MKRKPTRSASGGTRATTRLQQMLLSSKLETLRERCSELTESELAELLDVAKAYVDKLEEWDDMSVSTLFSRIEALGGALELRVTLPKSDEVRIVTAREWPLLLQRRLRLRLPMGGTVARLGRRGRKE